MEPIYKSITEVREKLNDNKAVIGFVGAPWTLIVYMLNLKDNNNLLVKKKYNRSQILEIKEILIRYICSHIKEQFQSGADVIQVFDPGLVLYQKVISRIYQLKPTYQS